MIDYSVIVLGIAAGTLLPAFAVLYLAGTLRVHGRYLAGISVGISFWFFFDTMGDAASLDANFSVYPLYQFGGASHILLILAFLAGVGVLAWFDSRALGGVRSEEAKAASADGMPRSLFLIPVAIALVMGIHGLGEGWDASSAAAYAPATDSLIQTLIRAFGDLPALVSYPIHKFLEATVVATAYLVYTGGAGDRRLRRWWDLPLLGLLFGGPSVIGASIGYSLAFDTSYFFAFGVASAVYAIIRLVEAMGPSTGFQERLPTKFGTKAFVALAIGFLLLYSAALLH